MGKFNVAPSESIVSFGNFSHSQIAGPQNFDIGENDKVIPPNQKCCVGVAKYKNEHCEVIHVMPGDDYFKRISIDSCQKV